jgi:hypothetical protein
MILSLSANRIDEANIMLLICTIGLLESLEKELLTIEECELYLFSPYSLSILEKKGIDENVINIVYLGTELEDIQSLFPDKLENKIRSLNTMARELLREIQTTEKNFEVRKWLEPV